MTRTRGEDGVLLFFLPFGCSRANPLSRLVGGNLSAPARLRRDSVNHRVTLFLLIAVRVDGKEMIESVNGGVRHVLERTTRKMMLVLSRRRLCFDGEKESLCRVRIRS